MGRASILETTFPIGLEREQARAGVAPAQEFLETSPSNRLYITPTMAADVIGHPQAWIQPRCFRYIFSTSSPSSLRSTTHFVTPRVISSKHDTRRIRGIWACKNLAEKPHVPANGRFSKCRKDIQIESTLTHK